MGFIDLNTTEDDETPSSSIACGPLGSVCFELWHACAGPMISLPKKGSVVVYFPQGHLEHVHDFPLSFSEDIHIPSHVFCRVVDVKLHVSSSLLLLFLLLFLFPSFQRTNRMLSLTGRVIA